MKKLKVQKKSDLFFSVLLTVVFLIFLGLIFYINLSCNPKYYDGDMHCDLNYARAAWEAKSIFPKNWVFGNQLYVFATPVFSALLYGITSNTLLSIGIASCIMTVLIVLSFNWMMKPLFTYNQRMCAFLAMVAFIFSKSSITFGTCGAQLFFTLASYYAPYLISAFITFGSYIRLLNKSIKKFDIIILILSVISSLALGIQSSRQTAVMVLPLVACEAFNIVINSIKGKKLSFSKATIFTALIFVFNLVGLAISKILNIAQNHIYEESTASLSPKAIISNAVDNMKCVLDVFYPYQFNRSTAIILAYFLAAFIVGIFIFSFIKLAKSEFENKADFSLILCFVLGVMSVFAVGCLGFIKIRTIYYFMIFPLLAVTCAYFLKNVKHTAKPVYLIIACLCVGLSIYHFHEENKIIKENTAPNAEHYQISNYLLENNYNCIYSPFGKAACISLSSNNKISAVYISNKTFNKTNSIPIFAPINYLCIKDEYKNFDNENTLYYIIKEEIDFTLSEAQKLGVSATVIVTLDNGDILCKMSENICAKVAQTEGE